MKIARTFTIDYNLAVDLQKKPNQSGEVCKALRAWLYPEMFTEILSIGTRQLLAVLLEREDVSKALKALLRHELTLTASEQSSS